MVIVIPAKLHSQAIQYKNLQKLRNYPLVCWSIAAAKLLEYEVILSTDSSEIASYFKGEGQICPQRTKGDYFLLKEAAEHIKGQPVIFLRPTTPFRNPYLLQDAINFYKDNELKSLRSVDIMPEGIDKLYIENHDKIVPAAGNTHDEANRDRQSGKVTCHPDGYIDIFQPDFEKEILITEPFKPFVIQEKVIEIDTPENLEYARWWVDRYGHPLLKTLKELYG